MEGWGGHFAKVSLPDFFWLCTGICRKCRATFESKSQIDDLSLAVKDLTLVSILIARYYIEICLSPRPGIRVFFFKENTVSLTGWIK